jgi:hypothetical protein
LQCGKWQANVVQQHDQQWQLHCYHFKATPLLLRWCCRKNVKDSNLSGEASILGGLLVVAAREGGIKYRHAETTFGEFPPTDEVIAAAKKAAVGAS